MKRTILMLMGLLVAPLGAEPPDLDDKAVLERIFAEAVPKSRLERRGKPGEELEYLPNGGAAYSGWVKDENDVAEVLLFQLKDGKMDGLVTKWHENGQMMEEKNYKDGVLDGLFAEWNEDGVKIGEVTYKDDVIVD
jgi:hypothetical protein